MATGPKEVRETKKVAFESKPTTSAPDDGKKPKSDKREPARHDPLIRDQIYPDPAAVFTFAPKPLSQVKDTGVFVLDANVLLFPYRTGKLALHAIQNVYSLLQKKGRLVVPNQAAREFATHRFTKIEELFSSVHQWRESLQNVPEYSSPSLEFISDYQEYKKDRAEANSRISKCRAAADEFQKQLPEWYHNDPVLSVYRDIFTANVLVGPLIDGDVIISDSENRNLHLIPPGSCREDVKKTDGGIGDKLIWHTILGLGETRKSDLVFVTQDVTKGDWVHYSGRKDSERVLFPRYELVEEYRRASDGGTFHIIELSTLLTLFKADKEVVETVQNAEEAKEHHLTSIPDDVVPQIVHAIRSSPHSFEWFRKNTQLRLSDDDFRRVISAFPDLFRQVIVMRRDENGVRVRGSPGVSLRNKNQVKAASKR